MPDVTITALTAAGAAPAGNVEFAGYDPAAGSPKTKKWTAAEINAQQTTPNFTTLQVASGATISALITGQITISVTSLAADSEVTDTDTLTGVATGDNLILNPTAAPAATLTFIAWVSGANTISVKVRNHDPATPATASVTFDVLAIRSA